MAEWVLLISMEGLLVISILGVGEGLNVGSLCVLDDIICNTNGA